MIAYDGLREINIPDQIIYEGQWPCNGVKLIPAETLSDSQCRVSIIV